MITVTYNNVSYECTKALKGSNYVHLLDANDYPIASFDGVSSFTGFTISGGSWTTPSSADSCYLVVVGQDGTLRRCAKTPTDIGGLQSAVNGMSSAIAGLQDSVGELGSEAYLHAVAIENLQSDVADHGSSIAGLRSAVDGLQDDVGTLYSVKQNQAISTTVTISVADWNSGTTCTKSVTGVTSSNIVFVESSNPSVSCTAQGTGTLTFTATATPTSSTTVKVVILP